MARPPCGALEDFVASRLPEALSKFVRSHPLVDLELTVGRAQAAGLNLIWLAASVAPARIAAAWRRATSAGRPRTAPLQVLLILYSPPSITASITRAIALAALARERRSWRIVCASGA